MTMMQHGTERNITHSTEIREGALNAWANVRWHAGKALEWGGERVFMLGNKVSEGIGASIEEHCDAAYAMGEQYRMRQMTKMLSLAFEAGQQAPKSDRPLGEAYQLGYRHGLQEATRVAV